MSGSFDMVKSILHRLQTIKKDETKTLRFSVCVIPGKNGYDAGWITTSDEKVIRLLCDVWNNRHGLVSHIDDFQQDIALAKLQSIEDEVIKRVIEFLDADAAALTSDTNENPHISALMQEAVLDIKEAFETGKWKEMVKDRPNWWRILKEKEEAVEQPNP